MAIKLSFEGGNVTLNPNQIEAECYVVSAVKNDPEGWSRFQGTIRIQNWIPLLETAFHLTRQNNSNPDFIKKYVEVDEELAQKLAKGEREGIPEEILQKYEPLRMCRIRDGRKSIELYKPNSKEEPAALMFTDGENRKRSRILLNDLALKALFKGIAKTLNGSVALKGNNEEFAIFQRKNDRVTVTTSTGYSHTLSFYDRFLLWGSLEEFPNTWEVRPFAFRNTKSFNRNGKAFIGIERVQIPLDKDAIKLLLLLG